jgi:spore coat protein CotF
MPEQRISDQMLVEDLLSSQKFLMSSYNMAIYESANPQLRNQFLEIHRQEQEGAQKLFNLMNLKGWYNPSPADQKMISETQAKVQQQIGQSQQQIRF